MTTPATAYVSGPMTGLPDHNYPAFHAAEEMLDRRGFVVLCPARNFNGRLDLPRWAYMRQDINNVMSANLVVVLEGWEHSNGARLEVLIARELGLPVYDVGMEPVLEPVYSLTMQQAGNWARMHFQLGASGRETPPRLAPPSPSVLEEAQGLIHGDRQASYGHPHDDFSRTGRIWGAILGIPDIDPRLVALMMVGVKQSRSVNDLERGRPIKRDNITDMAGYTGCAAMCQEFMGVGSA